MTSDIITRWFEVETGKADRYIGTGYSTNVLPREGVIYSYGMHFPLAETIKDKRGKITAFLLNGDTYSSTTTKHQNCVRYDAAKTEIPFVVIPFSVLEAAQIDRQTLKIVDMEQAGWYRDERSSTEQPEWWGERTWENENQRVEDEVYLWTARTHRLGQSLIRADVDSRRRVWDHEAGNYKTETGYRKNVYFLSGFDEQETVPSYFFCEMPNKKATTIPEAYEILKPEAVKVAEELGRAIQRQGDIFAIHMDVDKRALRKEGATFEKRGKLFNTNHEATEIAQFKDGTLFARGCISHRPAFRDPDHKRIKLGNGKAWYLIAKNTVPVSE